MKLPFINDFGDRSVFITGYTGFKGSWLTLWLHRLGARLTGYSLPPPTHPSNFVASGVANAVVRRHNADVRDAATLQVALEACRPEVVFHLAAQPVVRQSYIDPRQTLEVNVMGTANLLEAVRNLHRPCTVVVITSDKCYENGGQPWEHSETDRLGGNDPYSASKAAAEIITAAYRRSFFTPEDLDRHGVRVATVRAGNVIGGGDWTADRIVPDTVRALSTHQPVLVRNPAAIRPWQHVLEPLSGYLLLASRMLSSDDAELCAGWNFGPRAGDEATVGQLVEKFCQAWGSGCWQSIGNREQPPEDHVLRLSVDKAKAGLGWEPRWRFNEAIERTARWYRAFYASSARCARDLCLQDISDYEDSSASSDLSFVPECQMSALRI